VRETVAKAPAAQVTTASSASPATHTRRKLSYKEQRELDVLPGQIEALETEQTQLEKALGDGSLYASDPPRAAQMAARLLEVEVQWIAAMERLQVLQAV
jgi:ATP-binding cassette subfamily F protein uup